MASSVKIDGLQGFIQAVGKAYSADAIRIADGIEKCLAVISRKVDRYVPVDTGRLKESKTTKVEGRGFQAVGTIEFDTDYAIIVHEDLNAYHKYPTCAKYLERAIRETRGTCASIIRRELLDGLWVGG